MSWESHGPLTSCGGQGGHCSLGRRPFLSDITWKGSLVALELCVCPKVAKVLAVFVQFSVQNCVPDIGEDSFCESRVGLGSQMGCCHSTTKKKAFSVQWLTGIHQHHLGTLSPPGQRDQTPVGGATVHILTPHGSCEAHSGLRAPSTHAGPAAVAAGTSHRPALSHSL